MDNTTHVEEPPAKVVGTTPSVNKLDELETLLNKAQLYSQFLQEQVSLPPSAIKGVVEDDDNTDNKQDGVVRSQICVVCVI